MSDNGAISLLTRLEIKDACERLVQQFAFFGDSGQYEKWSHLFAEDGEMAFYGQSKPNVGRAALRAVAEKVPAATLVHVVTSHLVDVLSEDAAEGVAYSTVFLAPARDGGPQVMLQITPASVGIYRDAYTRTANGWRFARRSFEPLIVTSQMLETIKYTDNLGT